SAYRKGWRMLTHAPRSVAADAYLQERQAEENPRVFPPAGSMDQEQGRTVARGRVLDGPAARLGDLASRGCAVALPTDVAAIPHPDRRAGSRGRQRRRKKDSAILLPFVEHGYLLFPGIARPPRDPRT